MCDAKTKTFIKPQGGIDLDYAERDRAACAVSFRDELAHYFGTNALPLYGRSHEPLCKKQRFILYPRLQPSDIDTLARDDLDFSQFPLAAEAGKLNRVIKFAAAE